MGFLLGIILGMACGGYLAYRFQGTIEQLIDMWKRH